MFITINASEEQLKKLKWSLALTLVEYNINCINWVIALRQFTPSCAFWLPQG
jgi:hypothetical protein